MKTDFDFNLYIIEQLVKKLMQSSEKAARLALLSVKERVLCCIYSHYTIGELSDLSKAILINETAAPIRSINRAIAEITAEHLIRYENKKFIILSPELMEETVNNLL